VRFIDPPFCKTCGTLYQGQITNVFECAHCRDSAPDFSFARSAVVAREGVLDIIHRYKYNRALHFEPFLADLLLSRAVPALATAKWDLIVPVPLHATRLREREFNQAERLAHRLGSATGIPVETRLLRRSVPTQTQTVLGRPERIANVRRAFTMRRGKSLDGQRIVVLDDVFTTGATTSACARVLKTAGSGEVCVWTVARGA
jgi:ComF family protein